MVLQRAGQCRESNVPIGMGRMPQSRGAMRNDRSTPAPGSSPRTGRWRDHDRPVVVEPAGCVDAPAEHGRVGILDVGPQERPCRAGELVGCVPPDMASPGDPYRLVPQAVDESRRLRIVKHDDVEWGDARQQRFQVAGEHLPVMVVFRLVGPPAVAGITVQQVVGSFGDGEELGGKSTAASWCVSIWEGIVASTTSGRCSPPMDRTGSP